jgi:trafficking protein particle complex subunit 9
MNLRCSTSGIPFHTQPVSVVIPANSQHTLTLTGLALEPGTLIIRGCQLQLAGGIPREFLFPIVDGKRYSTSRSARHSGHFERVKSGGLDANPLMSASLEVSTMPKRNANSSPPQFLQYKVVPEQPLLRIRRSSLTMGALVLYDGEMWVPGTLIIRCSPLIM